jgi:hypothetical protein
VGEHLISLEPKKPVATYLHRDCLESVIPLYTARFCKRTRLYNPHRHSAISTSIRPLRLPNLPSPTPLQLHSNYPKHYIKTSRAFSALGSLPASQLRVRRELSKESQPLLLYLCRSLSIHSYYSSNHTQTHHTRNHDCPATPRRPHRDPS